VKIGHNDAKKLHEKLSALLADAAKMKYKSPHG
jgi:hypothetical protein